ncbi:MAG: OmpA family protein [Lentisphaeria bacterium]
MFSKNTFAFIACVCFVGLLVSCTKTPPIDLSGVRTNPNGAQSSANSNWGNNDPEGFTSEEPFPPVAGDALGNGWVSTDAPADENGMQDAANFLKNGSRWNEVVYFDYDSSEVIASERPKLDALADFLKGNGTFGLVIEGHCDSRGSDEYNRALSERRALSVLQYLSSLGITPSLMQTISYGEDKPVVMNATTEAEYQKNRRAEFLYGVRK